MICRFDQLPDRFDLLCQLPAKRFGWSFTGVLRGFTHADLYRIFSAAWASWVKVCDIDPIFVTRPEQAQVLIEFGSIDGRGSALAWAELPCPIRPQLRVRFDTAEPYVESAGEWGLDLQRVAAHEFGHSLGLGHLAFGSLMAPYYSTSIRSPAAADIREALQRYGKPTGDVPMPPEPVPPVPIPPVPIPPSPPVPVPPDKNAFWARLLKLILAAIIQVLDGMGEKQQSKELIDLILLLLRLIVGRVEEERRNGN